MAHSTWPLTAPSTFRLNVVSASIRLPLKMLMAPMDVRSHDCHCCSVTATRLRPSIRAVVRGKDGGRVSRMDVTCSSIV